MNKKVVLMILDGWGIATDPSVSAIDQANTEFVDSLYKKYPHSKLQASGMAPAPESAGQALPGRLGRFAASYPI